VVWDGDGSDLAYDVYGIYTDLAGASYEKWIYNNSVASFEHSDGGESDGFWVDNSSYCYIKNNVAASIYGDGGGDCFQVAGTNPDWDYNCADDSSEGDGGGSNNQSTADPSDVFTNYVTGDLTIPDTNAETYDTGTDLGVDYGLDALAWNRHSDTPTRDPWDIGAFELDGAAGIIQGDVVQTLPRWIA
jgi:hypothetical protein